MNVRDVDHSTPPEPADVRHPLARLLMQVLWPAFIGAAVTAGAVFSLVDPGGLDIVVERLGGNPEAAYTVGFIGFWAVFSLACSMTWLLADTERRERS